jgi:hypothetical protein
VEEFYTQREAAQQERSGSAVQKQEERGAAKRTYSRPSQGSRERAIRQLDDEIVERLPIPVLLGVARSDITENFGDLRGGGTRLHEGLDMLAAEGTPIVAPTEALVTGMGTWPGAGRYVETAAPGGERHRYMHLSGFADIEPGDLLSVGDLVGFVGDTGNAEGGPAHLHFEIRRDGRALDPYPRIQQEFSLEQKVALIERALTQTDDPDALLDLLISEYEPFLIQAQVAGVALPPALARVAEEAVPSIGSFSRDLTVGDEGHDVSVLQSILIDKNALDIAEPTGYFGPLTKAALARYQSFIGMRGTGYFGSATRARFASALDPAAAPNAAHTAPTGEVSLTELVELLVALELIAPEQRTLALSAARRLD